MRNLTEKEMYDMCIRALMEIRKNGMSRQHIKLIEQTKSYNEYLDRFMHDKSWRDDPYPDILLIPQHYRIMKVVLTGNAYTMEKEEQEKI